MKERILNYLANGLAASQVATLVGCSPAYISQLLADASFKEALRARILDNPTPVDDKLEDKYCAVAQTKLRCETVSSALIQAPSPAPPKRNEPPVEMRISTGISNLDVAPTCFNPRKLRLSTVLLS